MSALAEYLIGLAGALFVFGLAGLFTAGRKSRSRPGRARLERFGGRLGLAERIRRAGLEGALSPSSVVVAKVFALALALALLLPLVTLMPGRTGALVAALGAGTGFLLPDLVLARRARERHLRMVAALPDSLDLLATVLGAGRTTGAAFAAVARWGRGPLASELELVSRTIEAGAPREAGLELLRKRIGGVEVSAFTSGMERSMRLGSPVAEELRRQATDLRARHRRQIVEQASRAAPKIQLVIALILVPAVLLLVVAVLVANADRLVGAAFGQG
jgi:tight adherence protein C